MIKPAILCLALAFIAGATVRTPALAGKPSTQTHGPVFTADGRMMPPEHYYRWVFLTSDLGMSYNEQGSDSKQPPFSNVFVNPAAYREFLRTGTWPDRTVLVKEFRPSATEGSINHHGFYQSGKAVAVLVHVKDIARFKGGWAFFAFDADSPGKPVRKIPTDTTCYSCHRVHGAVDTTFVQFYPTLLPIAKQHSTLSAAYLQDEAQRHAPSG